MAIVRQHHLRDGTRRPAELVPGELVWASIVNGIENPLARGKSRPVILIEPEGWAWKTIGLTTRPRHCDGTPRIPIPARLVVERHAGLDGLTVKNLLLAALTHHEPPAGPIRVADGRQP